MTRHRLAAALVLAAITLAAAGQAPGIKRALLQRIDVPDNRETILGVAEIPAGGAAGRHTHFGVEVGYVLAGSTSLEIEGEPPRLLNAGDSYVIPAGKIHDAKVVGNEPAKVVATYVVEKGKPLATPAP